ncbi:myelin-oligodendrocyte glycoprotein-like isoform X2 [Phascolarctos cinereus]|uniref:Myelin-oligodendrocyte glycoprotein-like isoform X2 n=1 Tax=Phascolarctos cinereus TaxID=38626 RepID=A0A6P5L2P6_PHACI|nr:myelin-oligodendrocyte glycoprotein-like isoform X2 [Phascolarctos cinereus]
MMETANLSDSFLSSLLIFLFLETYTLASEQFSVIGPKEPIQAQVGGEAALPCHLSPQESAQHMKVIWSRSLQIVHHYEDGEDKFKDQSPDYQGRTELVRNGITSGNITLRIWNIRAPDEGWYKCHFYNGSHREEADVELCVSENIVQILPWPWEANGILAVRSAFEIGLTICHLWMLHTCGGLVYREKFDWMDQLLWIIFLVYVNLSVIKLGIGLYVICPFQNV